SHDKHIHSHAVFLEPAELACDVFRPLQCAMAHEAFDDLDLCTSLSDRTSRNCNHSCGEHGVDVQVTHSLSYTCHGGLPLVLATRSWIKHFCTPPGAIQAYPRPALLFNESSRHRVLASAIRNGCVGRRRVRRMVHRACDQVMAAS